MWTPPRNKDGTEFRWGYVFIGAFAGFALGAIVVVAFAWGGVALIATLTIVGAALGYSSIEARGFTRDLSSPDEIARIRRNSQLMGRILIVGAVISIVAKIAKSLLA